MDWMQGYFRDVGIGKEFLDLAEDEIFMRTDFLRARSVADGHENVYGETDVVLVHIRREAAY